VLDFIASFNFPAYKIFINLKLKQIKFEYTALNQLLKANPLQFVSKKIFNLQPQEKAFAKQCSTAFEITEK
jgi:hypothetical protein